MSDEPRQAEMMAMVIAHPVRLVAPHAGTLRIESPIEGECVNCFIQASILNISN